MSYTLRFNDSPANWNKARQKILSVSEYRKFFAETSPHKPAVIPVRSVNGLTETQHSDAFIRRHADRIAQGTPVYGWAVSCEEIFTGFPVATCVLTHQCAFLQQDGSLVALPTEQGVNHMIFLRDDERQLEEDEAYTYNQRVCFTNQINGYSQYYHSSVDSGSIYFAYGHLLDEDPDFEISYEFTEAWEFLQAIRCNSLPDNMEKWANMCTNVTILID